MTQEKRAAVPAAKLGRVATALDRGESFVAELRRRRVFRVFIGYLALGFAAIQLADLVYPVVDLPPWAFSATVAAWAIGAIPTLALAWLYDFTSAGLRRTHSAPRAFATADATPVAASSIAVLPFANLTSDPENDYFSDGMTEDIIARVSLIQGLKVISRTSVMQYKGTRASAREIAGALAVAHILEGSVRRAGRRVRIVAQLIDARTDEHRWAETYDRELEDIFAIQSDVASHIADALEARLSIEERTRIENRPTSSLQAYDLYLRGRFAWNLRTGVALQESVRLLGDSTRLDPRFAAAWAALADSYVTLGIYGTLAPAETMPAARAAAERALELEPALAEALTARAAVALFWDRDFEAAESGFHAAMAANPQYATAFQWYAIDLLAPQGRFDEARRVLTRARELDPLSPGIQTTAGALELYAGDFGAAVAACREALASHPAFGIAHYFEGLAHLAAGEHVDALEALHRSVEFSSGSAETISALAHAEAIAGDLTGARERLARLEADAKQRWVSPVLLAQVDVALGDLDRAIARLDEAYALRATDLIWVGRRPTFDRLREHAGLTRIQRRLGLPDRGRAIEPVRPSA